MWRSYTAAEKLKVIQYAKAHGNRAAGREFDGMSEANVCLWSLAASEGYTGSVTAQLATLEKSNPM